MEDKYRRVVGSSLLGYASYLQKVTPEQLEAGAEANKLILSSPKFWKLGQHKDPFIRHSFLTAVISLCENAAPLLCAETPRLAAAIFNRLSEDDPLVLPAVWDALLHGVIAAPVCHNFPIYFHFQKLKNTVVYIGSKDNSNLSTGGFQRFNNGELRYL